MAKINKELQEQIDILATNLEILNQKIMKNPNDILTPGEKALKDDLEDVKEKIEYISNILKSTEIWQSLRDEKKGIGAQISKFQTILGGLSKLEKNKVLDMLEKSSELNASIIEVNETINKLANNTANLFDKQRDVFIKKLNWKFFRLKKEFQVMMFVQFMMNLVIFGTGVVVAIIFIK